MEKEFPTLGNNKKQLRLKPSTSYNQPKKNEDLLQLSKDNNSTNIFKEMAKDSNPNGNIFMTKKKKKKRRKKF